MGGLKGLSLDGTPTRRGSLEAFWRQKFLRSAAAWDTLILRILASNRSCLTALCAMIKLLLALLLDIATVFSDLNDHKKVQWLCVNSGGADVNTSRR